MEIDRIATTTFQLGERTYTVAEAPRVRSRPWKVRFMAEVSPIFARISGAKDMELRGPEDLLSLFPVFQDLFTEGFDTLYELLLAYTPELEADRAYIEAHATDRQIFAAFAEVVKLADPFGMVGLMRGQIGRKPMPTPLNSLSPNGA